MKKIILHLGHDKTATTSMQFTFKENAELLLENGYLYPLPDPLSHHNRLFFLLFKDDVAEQEDYRLYFQLDHRWKEIADRYEKWLSRELSESSADKIIFSGEGFPNFKKNELQNIRSYFSRLLTDVEFEIHMFSREPIAYSESGYQQNARRFPSDDKVITFLYQEKVSNYIEVFGRNNVHVHKFEDACNHQGGPVCYLNKMIGIPDSVQERMVVQRHNSSISELAMNMLIYINKTLPYSSSNVARGLRFKRDIWHLLSLPGEPYKFNKDERSRVIEAARDDMDWLNENFGIHYVSDVEGKEGKEGKGPAIFTEVFAEALVKAFPESSPVVRKLIYEYLREEIGKPGLAEESILNIKNVINYIEGHSSLSIRAPYRVLAGHRFLFVQTKALLRKSKILTRIKRRVTRHYSQVKV